MSDTSDMLALANNIRDNDGLNGNCGGWFWIFVIFFLFMGNGYGYGRNASVDGALTRAEMQDGFNNQNIVNILGNMSNQINSGFDGIQLGMANGFSGVQASLAESRYSMQDCCCQIKNAIASDGERTRALITQNEIQRLREELQDAKNENLATGLVTAQGIQTNNLENFMRALVNGNCGCGC